MERQPTPKQKWDKQRKRKFGRRSIWDVIRQDQLKGFMTMSPEELIHKTGEYEILSAQSACSIKLQEARASGNEETIAAWQAVSDHLAMWRKEYYRRSQEPSRFSAWAAQEYNNRPIYNPRARW